MNEHKPANVKGSALVFYLHPIPMPTHLKNLTARTGWVVSGSSIKTAAKTLAAVSFTGIASAAESDPSVRVSQQVFAESQPSVGIDAEKTIAADLMPIVTHEEETEWTSALNKEWRGLLSKQALDTASREDAARLGYLQNLRRKLCATPTFEEVARQRSFREKCQRLEDALTDVFEFIGGRGN